MDKWTERQVDRKIVGDVDRWTETVEGLTDG